MPKIVPHLWFDKEAGQAARFYVSAFPGSRILHASTLEGTPSGQVEVLVVELRGQEFQLISAGPYFKPNPSISFLVACESGAEVDRYWKAFGEGSTALMPLDAYPFAERYGWLEDRYGFSWQFIHSSGIRPSRKIVPTLMFTGGVLGRAEEAARRYASVFPGSKLLEVLRYGPDEAPNTESMAKHLEFSLSGQGFAAMDSAYDHDFAFNEAVSLIAYCGSQEEIDRYWKALSARPEAEQCGWLKDEFGVSWQIVPEALDRMMRDPDPERRARVTEAFLAMKKFDLAKLEKAYRGDEERARA